MNESCRHRCPLILDTLTVDEVFERFPKMTKDERVAFANKYMAGLQHVSEILHLMGVVDATPPPEEPEGDGSKVWKFHWDCGVGGVEGVFIATQEEIDKAMGSNLYFGEILGKHSEVQGTLDKEDLTCVTDNVAVVEFFRKHFRGTGYDPLSYIQCEHGCLPEDCCSVCEEGEQAEPPSETDASLMAFQIAVMGLAREWVEEHHEEFGFDYDPTQLQGSTAVIWPVEPGDNERLATLLEKKGISFEWVEVC